MTLLTPAAPAPADVTARPAAPAPPPARRRFDPLGVTSAALMANTAVTSVLGMAFWAAASRWYPARQLGQDAALISAMMLLSVISQLNLAMGISRLLPQVRSRRWRPVAAAYGVTAVTAVALTGAFVVVAPRVSDGFRPLTQHPELAVALVVAVVLWNVFALQDAVLTAARWAVALPIENGLFGLLKIGLMVWLVPYAAGHGIFVAWLVAMALMLLPVNVLLFGRVLPAGSRPAGEAAPSALPINDRRRITRYLAVDYVAGLLSQGYTTMLPLLVVAVLGQAANAYFYIAFVIAGAVRAVAQSLSLSLVVEGAHDESELVALTRLSIRRYVRFAVPGTALLVLGAGLMLTPFGADYVRQATTLLQLLLLATVPQAVVTLYLGVERVRAKVRRVLAAEAATGLLVAVGVTAGMHASGLTGVGVGWLVAQTAVAVLVVPHLWRVLRSAA
ncbi:MAG: lipopolysaccharide biosynthesis protein [Acidimicrobiales bacterium]